jgi:hypothetical protein
MPSKPCAIKPCAIKPCAIKVFIVKACAVKVGVIKMDPGLCCQGGCGFSAGSKVWKWQQGPEAAARSAGGAGGVWRSRHGSKLKRGEGGSVGKPSKSILSQISDTGE